MNEELLNRALEAIFETVASGQEFVLEHAPDVIHQLLLYTTVTSGLLALAGVTIPTIWGFLLRKAFEDGWDEGTKIFLLILGSVFSVVSLLAGVINLFTFLKVTLAPKLFLLEYAADLIK